MKDETVEISRELAETIYSTLVGVVIEKELAPKDCKYVSQGWRIKEELREILGYDGGDEGE